MKDSALLDSTFHIILERMVASGEAPHYTGSAQELGVPSKEGRKVLRQLSSTPGLVGWLYPKTDNILPFAPFKSLPTGNEPVRVPTPVRDEV